MKLIIVILTTAILQVSASSFAQRVTLNEKNASISKIFNHIREQTGYDFFYNLKLIKQAKPVSIDVKDAGIDEVLKACFQGQPFTYIVKENAVIIKNRVKDLSQESAAVIQTITVRGRVLDEKGLGLPGATVKVKGTTQGTVTDQNGVFKLTDVDENAMLVVSFIGYNPIEVKVNDKLEMTITLLPHANSLNDVVVVGFATQKKIDLTGAVDQISGKDLQNRPLTNVGDALQGMMANLNVTTNYAGGSPDATKTINVRGYTGFSSSGGNNLAGPLILVDGVETNINSINVNDIESISLLKDAASSAAYGSRAPNGVLLITTKQGKKNQPLRLSYSNNFSYAQPLNEPTMVNSLEFANTMDEAYTNAGLAPLFTADALKRIKAYIQDPQNTPTNVAVPGSDAYARYDPVFPNSNNDWFKIYLKKWSASQQHNLSVDGGSDKITYFFGVGTTDHNGLYNYFNDSYKRDNFRANITADVNKYVTFSLKTSYSQENIYSPYNGGTSTGGDWFHQLARIWPTVALIDPNGGYEFASYVHQIEQGGSNTSRTNNSRISGDITIKPLPGWNITGHYNYDYNNYNILSSVLPFTYAVPSNPEFLSTTISSVSQTYSATNYYNYNLFSSYEKQIGGHYFKVLLGEQTEKKTYSNLTGTNQYLYSITEPSLALTSGTTPSTTDLGGYSWATNSIIGRINYNYKEKYLVEGNASYMGTSLFPINTRYHLFTSASAGWNVSREDFFKPLLKAINNLKFRASYGGLGDISQFLNSGNYYPYLSNLRTGSSTSSQWIFTPATGGRLPYVANPSQLVSPTLTWAKPSELDLGVDVDFLTDFSATFDWYNKNITDQFGPPNTYPAPLGVTPPTVNSAASRTIGWDMTASWKHRVGEVNLMARATLSHYAGKITKYTGNPQSLITQPYVGEPMGAIWGFKTVGKFQTQAQVNSAPSQTAINATGYLPGDIQYADLNHDGKITYGSNTVSNPGDRTIIGNSTPKYLYGFTTSANWKGIDLVVFIQGQGHADYMPSNNYFWGITSEYQSTVTPKLADRWSPTNPDGYFPRIDINNGAGKNQIPQSGYLLNAAYTRLKNVQLSYTIPDQLTKKFHVYQLRLYTSIENALTFSGAFAHQYVDPELLQSDEKIYPLQRTYSFGLQMNIK
ncbi:TonB-dependent receptor [Mucilaginibacter arboris]|nr:TonB-dependent receptor [Mucilaginibacter arboris]